MIYRSALLAVMVALWISTIRTASADSALELLSGFDAQRLESVYPLESPVAIAELAKLVYRMQTIKESSLVDRIDRPSAGQLGSAIQFNASIEQMRLITLPGELADVLEFAIITSLTATIEDQSIEIFVPGTKSHLAIGDRIAGAGVVIGIDESDSRVAAIAAANLRWFPSQVPSRGWELLRDAGVDVGLLADLKQRDRQSLSAADGEAFYGMLQAAKAINHESIIQSKPLPKPKRIDPLQLLQASKDHIGQWMELDLETVQVTRVFVTAANRQRQLDRDHYYQIDAVADLDNVIVKVNPQDANDRPALFEGRYPVSIVAANLPTFLQNRIRAEDARDVIATSLHTKINVRGFFFRLWSYETEFMDAHGGGSQFGPLVVAASIRDREPLRPATDPSRIIAALAALAVGAGVLGIFWWHRRTAAEDRAIRQARQARDADRVSDFEQP